VQTIKLLFTIQAPIGQVWEALTDPVIIAGWTAGPAKFEAIEGGKFSLWDDDIHGTNTKVVPNKLLEEDWYSESTSRRCYKVSFSLSEENESSTIELRHANVADNEVADFTDGWQRYYFEPIKLLLEDRNK
jgi:uncharacterized protein YndB with AHSA1/START domain